MEVSARLCLIWSSWSSSSCGCQPHSVPCFLLAVNKGFSQLLKSALRSQKSLSVPCHLPLSISKLSTTIKKPPSPMLDFLFQEEPSLFIELIDQISSIKDNPLFSKLSVPFNIITRVPSHYIHNSHSCSRGGDDAGSMHQRGGILPYTQRILPHTQLLIQVSQSPGSDAFCH